MSDCGYAQLAACSGSTIIGEAAAMTGYRRKSCWSEVDCTWKREVCAKSSRMPPEEQFSRITSG